MSSRYHRPWPLPPKVNRAIADKAYREGQGELDRWFLTCLIVFGSVILGTLVVQLLALLMVTR